MSKSCTLLVDLIIAGRYCQSKMSHVRASSHCRPSCETAHIGVKAGRSLLLT